MQDNCFTAFQTEIAAALIPAQLNDPFGLDTPVICKVAARELQHFITEKEHEWKHNFGLGATKSQPAKGKMFGVLVVRNSKGELGYLGTFSGRLADESHHSRFVPSLFDISTGDYFINKGMTELTAIGDSIKSSDSPSEIQILKAERKAKSLKLQQQLFDSYHFLNQKGETKSLCAIFEETAHKTPPSGAGECAAPKLLQYAFENEMQTLAIAEFWWGKSPESQKKKHKMFYPACEDKCRPILGYMLAATENE